MANIVDPDETARYEPSHLDLHCLQRYVFWSTGLKELQILKIRILSDRAANAPSRMTPPPPKWRTAIWTRVFKGKFSTPERFIWACAVYRCTMNGCVMTQQTLLYFVIRKRGYRIYIFFLFLIKITY